MNAQGSSNATISAKPKSSRRKRLAADFIAIITTLATDASLELCRRNHALTGEWEDQSDCHGKPDLVLIYRKPDDDTLQLVRTGSHAELGW